MIVLSARPVGKPTLFPSLYAVLALLILAGCSAHQAARTEVANESEDVVHPVTRVPGKANVYALPEAQHVPAAPPPWMTPTPVAALTVSPPVAYRPATAPEDLAVFAFEVPEVRAGRSAGAEVEPPPPSGETFAPAVTPAAPPALSTTFNSTDFDVNATNTGGFLLIPSDASAAAGPNHVLNVTNVTLRVHSKSGTLLADTALDDFFAVLSPATLTFDPKVVFDQHAGRWVVVTLEQLDDGPGGAAEASRMFVAVSDDANPLGTWFQTTLDTKTNIGGIDRWADYPGLAVDEEAIYLTANMFAFAAGGSGYGGVRLWVLDKGLGTGGFYDGGTLIASLLNPYAGGGIATTTQPAHVFGNTAGATGTFLVSYSGLTNGTTEAVQVVRIDNPLGSPVFTQAFIFFGNVEDFAGGSLPGAPQNGTATPVSTNDRRALNAVWYDDSLWLSATVSPKAGDPDAGEATAYWWRIDTSNLALLSMADQGAVLGEDIATDTHTFFPSVAVNGIGQMALGYSASAASTFAGSYYTTREPGDSAGTTSGSGTLAAGVASYVRTFCGENRWGDYSGMSVDPVDGCFWVYNQRARSTGTTTSIDCDGNGSNETVESGRWETTYGKLCPSGACPADMVLASIDLSGTQTRKAAVNLRTVEDVTVKLGADVTLRAGSRIGIGDGFAVENGASLALVVAASPCT